jgi:predicted thioesterase
MHVPVGHIHEMEVVVDDPMSPPFLPIPVLSTPGLVLLIEETCRLGVEPFLSQGRATVGTHIDVSHARAVRLGETLRIKSVLVAVDGRRLVFETEAHCARGQVSAGRHERSIIRLETLGLLLASPAGVAS